MSHGALRQLLLIAVMLALASMCGATVGYASDGGPVQIHQARYDWHGTGGTTVYEDIPGRPMYTVGDVSGAKWLEVTEKVWYDPVLYEGGYKYQWVIQTDAGGYPPHSPANSVDVMPGVDDHEWLTSFAVPSGGAPPLAVSSGGWTFTDTGTKYEWVAPPGFGLDGNAASFSVETDLSYVISGAGQIDYFAGVQDDPGRWERTWICSDYWVVSHPDVPEPGSLALLGCGLVGFLPMLRRRRTV